MGKGMYIGVDGKARKCKKAYIGIDGIARKIKKIYIGIANVARLIFSSGGIEYFGKIGNLVGDRLYGVGISLNAWAIFAQGYDSDYNTMSSIDVYASSFVKTTIDVRGIRSVHSASSAVGNYGLIAGGASSDTDGAEIKSVWYYDDSLVYGSLNSNSGLYYKSNHLAGASVGDYAIFAGGVYYDDYTSSYLFNSSAIAYNGSLTRYSISSLSTARCKLAGTNCVNYALFAGGTTSNINYSGASNVVDAFNTSLTRTIATILQTPRLYCKGVRVGNYALITGGGSTNGFSNVVDSYNSSLTKSVATNLETKVVQHGVCSSENNLYALIAGGNISSYSKTKVVNIYDESLTKTLSEIDETRSNLLGASIHGGIIFAGGTSNNSYAFKTD